MDHTPAQGHTAGTTTREVPSNAASLQRLLDVDGVWPRPGWMVLNSARESEFTGEVVFDSEPAVRVYLDRGKVYVAERVNDVPIEERLVAARALSRADLDIGALQVEGAIYLGRLFDRVPTVDRVMVMTMTEVMTNETISWIESRSCRRRRRGRLSVPLGRYPPLVRRSV